MVKTLLLLAAMASRLAAGVDVRTKESVYFRLAEARQTGP
jgi:hypothetical protein